MVRGIETVMIMEIRIVVVVVRVLVPVLVPEVLRAILTVMNVFHQECKAMYPLRTPGPCSKNKNNRNHHSLVEMMATRTIIIAIVVEKDFECSAHPSKSAQIKHKSRPSSELKLILRFRL